MHSEQREDVLSLLQWVVPLSAGVSVRVLVIRTRSKTRSLVRLLSDLFSAFSDQEVNNKIHHGGGVNKWS